MRCNTFLHFIALSSLMLLRATGDLSQEDALDKFHRRYKDVYLIKPEEFYYYFAGDACQDKDGCVDLEHKVFPMLKYLRRRNEMVVSGATSAGPEGDLSAIGKQFLELLEMGFLYKSIRHVSFNKKILEKNAIKRRMNCCKVVEGLISQFCGQRSIGEFPAILCNAIIDDFMSLGFGASQLAMVKAKVHSIFGSLNATSAFLQAYIAKDNVNRQKNIQVMTESSSIQPKGGWFSPSAWSEWYYAPKEQAKPVAAPGQVLDSSGLTALERELDEVYLTKYLPEAGEVFLWCLILLVDEVRMNGGSLTDEQMQPFIKTLSDLEILNSMAMLLNSVPNIAKHMAVKYITDLFNTLSLKMKDEAFFKTISGTIEEVHSANDKVTKGEVAETVSTKARPGLKTLCDPSKHVGSPSGKFKTEMLIAMQKRLVLSIFRIDEHTDFDKIKQDIETFGGRNADPKILYTMGVPAILEILTDKKAVADVPESDMVVKQACLKAGSVIIAQPIAEKMQQVLKSVPPIIKERITVDMQKSYAMGALGLFFVVDILLLVMYWMATKSDAEEDTEE